VVRPLAFYLSIAAGVSAVGRGFAAQIRMTACHPPDPFASRPLAAQKLPFDHSTNGWSAISLQIREVFAEYTPIIEPLSLDEPYLDVTRNLKGMVSATRIAEETRARIRAETELTASAGVSYNKPRITVSLTGSSSSLRKWGRNSSRACPSVSFMVSGRRRPSKGIPFGGWGVFLMNNVRPPFDDINFRRALSHAIDRKTICDKIYYGLVERSGIPAPASSWWYDKQADDSVDYDLDKARFYLGKSKYAEGTSFDLMASAVPYLLDSKDCVVYLQAELAKIGVNVTLQTVDNAVIQTAFSGRFSDERAGQIFSLRGHLGQRSWHRDDQRRTVPSLAVHSAAGYRTGTLGGKE